SSDSVCNMLDKEWECSSILVSRWLSEPCVMLVFQDAVLVALAPESKGTVGYAHSSNNAFASFKSTVSKPSVNQSYTGASRAWASWRLAWCCHSRARLVATRIVEDIIEGHQCPSAVWVSPSL